MNALEYAKFGKLSEENSEETKVDEGSACEYCISRHIKLNVNVEE